ncbi:MAG: hypothetical protein AAFX06_33745, partial [Planctomycetota bacterium]
MSNFVSLGNQLVLIAVSVFGAIFVSPVTPYNTWFVNLCWASACVFIVAVLFKWAAASATRLLNASPKRNEAPKRPFLPHHLLVQLLILGAWFGMLRSSNVSREHLESRPLIQGVVAKVYESGTRRSRSTQIVLK